MTITANLNRVSYAGDGTTNPWSLAGLYFLTNTDLKVIRRNTDGSETALVYATDYTVTGAGNPAGGAVTPIAATVVGATYVIIRDPPVTQNFASSDGGPLPAASLNQTFDKVVMIAQRLYERVSRSLLMRETDLDGAGAFDARGNRITNAADPLVGSDLVTFNYITTAMSSLINAALAAANYLDKAGGTMTGPIVLSADPLTALQAATKNYVDNVAAGLDVKASCRLATTANDTLSGLAARDGVTPVAGDRVLVKNQTTASQNGIYVAAAGAWARATDMNIWSEVPGANAWIEEGTVNADNAYVCTSNNGGTIGTTAITWVLFGGSGVYQASNVNLAALAGLTGSADQQLYFTALGAMALTSLTSFGRSLQSSVSAAAAVATLGAISLSATGQVITGGATVTSNNLGTITTGTVTPDPGARPIQHYTNNGAHTLAPSANVGSVLVDITNGATAGAITTSGFTKVSGDAFTTTNASKFRCHISIGAAGSLLSVQALQ